MEQQVETQNRWFAKAPEAVIEADLPICDAHHHLWDYTNKRYLSQDYIRDITGGHNVVSSVYVDCFSGYRTTGPEALRPVGEVDFVEAQRAQARAAGADICQAIVGFADLRLGAAVGEVLDALITASPRLTGLRYSTAWDASSEIRQAHTRPGPLLLEDPTFLEGFAELQQRNLSFDVWAFHPQMSETIALAKRFPETPIIIDHLGGILGIGPYTDKADEVFDAWRVDIQSLAECPNIHIKLGGMCMPMSGLGWRERDTPPDSSDFIAAHSHYFMHAIEAFGVERCMFESNFPMDRVNISFNSLWNAFKRMTASLSADERASLFHDTAVRVYKIDQVGLEKT